MKLSNASGKKRRGGGGGGEYMIVGTFSWEAQKYVLELPVMLYRAYRPTSLMTGMCKKRETKQGFWGWFDWFHTVGVL